MPKYKLSPEERAQEKERKENLRNIMKGLDIKNFDDLKDAFKLMVGEIIENGLCISRPQNRTCTDFEPHTAGFTTAPLPESNRAKCISRPHCHS